MRRIGAVSYTHLFRAAAAAVWPDLFRSAALLHRRGRGRRSQRHGGVSLCARGEAAAGVGLASKAARFGIRLFSRRALRPLLFSAVRRVSAARRSVCPASAALFAGFVCAVPAL